MKPARIGLTGRHTEFAFRKTSYPSHHTRAFLAAVGITRSARAFSVLSASPSKVHSTLQRENIAQPARDPHLKQIALMSTMNASHGHSQACCNTVPVVSSGYAHKGLYKQAGGLKTCRKNILSAMPFILTKVNRCCWSRGGHQGNHLHI